MNALELTVDVEYAHAKARDERAPHYVAVYLDRSWASGRSDPVKLTQTRDDTPLRARVTLTGRWPRHAQVPRDAQLCFQATTTTTNSVGVPCQQECGALTVNLADALAQYTAQPETWLGGTLRVHTTREHLAKGTVRVRVHRAHIATSGVDCAAATAPQVTFGPATRTANLEANVPRILSLFNRYLERQGREETAFRVVFPGTARINCPLTPSEQTVANTQVCVPFAGYMRYEVPATQPGWWRAQLLVRDARLHGGTGSVERYARYVRGLPTAQRANEWLQVCAQYTQQLPYVSDRTAGQPVEIFSDAKANLAGDCEDLGNAINQDADALDAAAACAGRDAEDGDRETAAVLAQLRAVGREYVRFQPIYGVTSSHVEGERSAAVTGAHSAVQALPRDYVAACVARWQPAHPAARLAVHDARLAGRLPVLTGEGTGLLDPGAGADPVPPAWRDAVYDHAATGETAKKTLFQAPAGAPSDFYKVALFGASRETLERYRVGSWRFAYRLADGRYSKGVKYEDLMARSDQVLLVPYGHRAMEHALTAGRIASGVGAGVDETRGGWPGEFDADELAALRAVTKTRLPPPPQTAPPAGLAPVALDAPHSVLRAAVRGLPGCNRATARPVHLYYAPAQLTERLARQLHAHLGRVAAQLPVVGHAVAREWHSAGLPEVWRLSIYFADDRD